MTKLLEETIEVLSSHGKAMPDVVWCGCRDFEIPVELFCRLANCKYDSGFGRTKIATDLVLVGADWWLERHEYDGSEWWGFHTVPAKPESMRDDVLSLFSYYKLKDWEYKYKKDMWEYKYKENKKEAEKIKQAELKQLAYLSNKYKDCD